MGIGQKIKELRMQKGMIQETLAKELRIGRSTLANYELDERQIPNELIPVIAKYFGVTTDYLHGLED